MKKVNSEDCKRLFRQHNGILRYSNAIKLGIPRYILDKLAASGDLEREARGLYRLVDSDPLGNPDLVQVSLLVPRAVICLISALYYFDFTTQIPHRVYIALPEGIKNPKLDYPPIEVFHFSKRSFKAGIEEHLLDGTQVQIYTKEKTIADCFKFRKRIGASIATEALKDYMRQDNPNISLLMQYAKLNRVEQVIRPYIEALS